MGSIFGGGGGSTGSINSASQQVANTALQGGQRNSDTYNNLANYLSDYINAGANTAATGAMGGAQTSAAAQQQALDYLMRNETQPASLRSAALNSLGNLYNGQGSITERAMASPYYQEAVRQGENAVLRNASATGGLRSGTTSENLANVNQNALLNAYNDQVQGLQGLAALPSNANTLAGYMANIGNTLGQGQINSANLIGQGQATGAQNYAQYVGQAANELTNSNNAAAQALSQGQIASAQNKAQSQQNSTNNMMGLAQLGLTAAMMMSDRRLKENIEFIGEENGHRKYRWSWNKLANAFGLVGNAFGVMADEADQINPDAISIHDGYLCVNYEKLGVSHGAI